MLASRRDVHNPSPTWILLLRFPKIINIKPHLSATIHTYIQIEEIKKILAKIEQTIKDKADDIPPNKKSEVETDVKEINQEIIKPEPDRDNNKILTKI